MHLMRRGPASRLRLLRCAVEREMPLRHRRHSLEQRLEAADCAECRFFIERHGGVPLAEHLPIPAVLPQWPELECLVTWRTRRATPLLRVRERSSGVTAPAQTRRVFMSFQTTAAMAHSRRGLCSRRRRRSRIRRDCLNRRPDERCHLRPIREQGRHLYGIGGITCSPLSLRNGEGARELKER
jgi:hypothetical protein